MEQEEAWVLLVPDEAFVVASIPPSGHVLTLTLILHSTSCLL